MIRFRGRLVCLISVAVLAGHIPQTLAQQNPDNTYTIGEFDWIKKRYIGPDEKIAGQARFLHGIEKLQGLVQGARLTGDGVIVAVWDGGLIQANHQDLRPRVSLKEPSNAKVFLNNHATHVAGTIAGTGLGRPAAGGMAPKATLWSFDFKNDTAEMQSLAMSGAGVDVSNHSYSYRAGWDGICFEPTGAGGKDRIVWVWAGREDDEEDRNFGWYGGTAAEFDRIARSNPEWTMVVAAGNARIVLFDPHNAAKTVPSMEKYKELAVKYDFAFPNEQHRLWECSGRISSKRHRSNRFDGEGFDSIPHGPAAAKNVITAGAMEDPPIDEIWNSATGQFKPLDRKHVRTTDFSSWGPVDDGRIKPDIVASGHALLATAIPQRCGENCTPADATAQGDDSNYVQMSGTSMATPVVSGAVVLLNELSRIKRAGRKLRSDEAKALLIHTALSPADVEGPTYKVGWGAMQAELAGRLLIGSTEGESLQMIDVKADKPPDKPTELRLRRAGLRPARVSLVWLDEEGLEQKCLDSRDPVLVNDLDMTLTSPSGEVIQPWTLDPQRPSDPAERGHNVRDNLERIDVPKRNADEKGEWTLRIKGPAQPGATAVKAALAIWGFAVVKDEAPNK